MRQKLINSQMSNFKTYQMYMRQLLTLAENVFEFENMPEFIDIPYLNKQLLRKGAIAFFHDEVLGVIALPFTNVGNLDVYGRPLRIQVIASNGYTKTLKQGEFVIMYDNNGQYPLYLDICQYAERIALDTRTSDINIAQQKTPRIFKTKNGQEKSIKDIINNIDVNVNTVVTYDDINLTDDTTIVLAPAPFVADKVDEHKAKNWSEFLRLIGISNLSLNKKERMITDEIQAQNGGTIASRYSRYEPRAHAIKEINKKFGEYLENEISVKYYDGEPNMQDVSSNEEYLEIEEGDNNV